MAINLNNYSVFQNTNPPVYFPPRDIKRILRMKGEIILISTVCPDYPHEEGKYSFNGELGKKASLTALGHLDAVPGMINVLQIAGLEVKWIVLVADLPELVATQKEFYVKVAGSKEEYMKRCESSAREISELSRGRCKAMTFSQFYSDLDYLGMQQAVAKRILLEAETDKQFSGRFSMFVVERAELARLFRGRDLSQAEYRDAAAHGMSLYITHGTLLRKKFLGKNALLVNHATPNLKHFHLAKLMDGFEELENTPKMPVGIVECQTY